ncbi:MAG TPA: twin-arginine translocation signal domain-containing protein, partial [Gemmataceae bacterium]|nr:twin-arginine translocation signal domain-containing protein [Gemmataceae bacterium]
MSHQDPKASSCAGLPSANRREFLQGGAGLAASAALAAPAPADEPVAGNTLPTIGLGPHQVTRLIIGGNPI